MPDEFVEHGSVEILRKKHGVTAVAAVERILALLDTQAVQVNTTSVIG